MTVEKNMKQKKQAGFTLIEMIGVLAIIAILVAAVAPRIFEAIEDSRVTTLTTNIKQIQTAVTKYYADIGSLRPLAVATGLPANDNAGNTTVATSFPATLNITTPGQTTARWAKFRGPYLEGFESAKPYMGLVMTLPSQTNNTAAAAGGAAAAANNSTQYDLDGDSNTDIVGGNVSEIVSLVITGITQREFEKVDAMLDASMITNLSATERQERGRVKWVIAGGGTMRVYIAHK